MSVGGPYSPSSLVVPESQLEYVKKAVKLGHPCTVDSDSDDIAGATYVIEEVIRDAGWSPSTVKYSDIRLGEILTFATEAGPKSVILLQLDEPFKGQGYSFIMSLAKRPPGALILPSGVHIEAKWNRIQSTVIVNNQKVIFSLSEHDRASLFEYYQSA